MSYVADTHPQANLLARRASSRAPRRRSGWRGARRRCTATSAPLFRDKDNDAQKKLVQGHLELYDAWLKGTYVLGETFSVADGYTLVFTLWAGKFGLTVGPKMRASAKALLQRPAVQRAVETQQLKFENL